MSDPMPDSFDLTVVRVFHAPREVVFRCMTDPEDLTHFWGPTGVSTPLDTIRVDARIGGAFETTMVNDADRSRYTMRAVYLDILEPERLVWTEPDTGVTTTSTFVALSPTMTELRIRQSNVPEAFRSPEAQAGFATSLDRFAAYLEVLGRDPRPGAR